jgi:UPF0271 protein
MKYRDETGRRVIVLDTSAFVAGLDPFSINEELYTVPMVNEELKGNSLAAVRIRTAVESGRLAVKVPSKSFIEGVKDSATLVGDWFFLSETDLQVLALALELKIQGYSPLIATDDYSIQNVANQIGIEFASLGTFGIRKRLQWVRHCPACHKKYPANYRSGNCMICGTALRRKPLRKNRLQSRDDAEHDEVR